MSRAIGSGGILDGTLEVCGVKVPRANGQARLRRGHGRSGLLTNEWPSWRRRLPSKCKLVLIAASSAGHCWLEDMRHAVGPPEQPTCENQPGNRPQKEPPVPLA